MTSRRSWEMPVSSVPLPENAAEFGFVDKLGSRYALGPRLVIGGGSTVTTSP